MAVANELIYNQRNGRALLELIELTDEGRTVVDNDGHELIMFASQNIIHLAY